jgi:hypothetical protein
VTPSFLITIRKIRKFKEFLQLGSRGDQGDMNMYGYFFLQDTCMPPFRNPRGIRKPFMVTPSFLIAIRMIRELKDNLWGGSRRNES